MSTGQADGDIRPDLDPAATAWALLSLIASHRFRSIVMADRCRLEPQLTALFLGALR